MKTDGEGIRISAAGLAGAKTGQQRYTAGAGALNKYKKEIGAKGQRESLMDEMP